MTGLALNGIAGLPADVAKPRTASKLFREVFDPLDELRAAKRIPQKTIAEKNGFKRAAWFEYKRKGTIPFHLLESVARYLGVKLQASVITGMSERAATSGGETIEEPMREFIEPLMELLEQVPEDRRQYAAGAIYAAAKEAVRSLPFVEPSADQKKASRGRSSKS